MDVSIMNVTSDCYGRGKGGGASLVRSVASNRKRQMALSAGNVYHVHVSTVFLRMDIQCTQYYCTVVSNTHRSCQSTGIR
jgi:succinyl-CoA synthetase beta subunit